VPLGHGCHWLGDNELGALLRQFFCDSGEGVTEPKAHEEDFWLAGRPEGCAGEAGEFFFSSAGGRAANLLTVDDERFPRVVFLQGENIPIWELGFCEGDSWFHGA
jgi:hypothetical protein